MGLEVAVTHYRVQSEHLPREAHEIHQNSLNEAEIHIEYSQNKKSSSIRPDALHYMSGHSDLYVFAPQYLQRGPKYNTFTQSLG